MILKRPVAIVLVWLAFSTVSPFQEKEPSPRRGSFMPCSPCPASAAEDVSETAAAAIVEEYWTSEPKSRYALLSQTYKQRLRRLGVNSASQYERAIREPERVWGKRTYQSTKVVGQSAARIALLIEWEQEGYQGVMTFIFDLVLEKDRWRIENIVH